MPTLSGLQVKTWTDSLALELVSHFLELVKVSNLTPVVSAVGVHVRTSSARPARRTDSRQRRQQRDQLESSQTVDRLRYHVVAWRTAGTQRSTKGNDSDVTVR